MPADRETHASPDSDDAEALERLRAVVRANPRSTTFVALAHALCDAGLDEEAEDVSRKGLGQHPELVTGQVALGRALFRRGRSREAEERLVAAATSSPDNGDAFRWLGEVILRRGDRDKARVLLEYAEELLPSDGRVGELLVEAGGVPLPRQTRPKTDFEDTRVSKNAHALAERMHEEPPPRASHTPKRGTSTDDAVTSEFEPRPANKNGAGKPGAPAPPRAGSAAQAGAARAGSALAQLVTRARELWQQGGRPLRIGAVGIVVLLLAGSAWLLRPKQQDPAPFTAKWSEGAATGEKRLVAAVDMTAAIAAGTLDGLASVRVLGKRLAEASPPDPDQLAAAAFASALLANDYGVPGNGDALELGSLAAKATPSVPFRTGLIEASRALAALSSGKLPEAEAAAKRALEAAPLAPEALLATARVDLRGGRLPEAEAALLKAVGRTPVLTAAVLDLAAVRLDAGQPLPAAEGLISLLAQRDDLRARLLLSEAERAQGKPPTSKSLRERCREEGRESPILRTSCAAETAQAARLAGDRSAALRAARNATAGAGRNPRALATGALVLANLGEHEAAADAVKKIRDDTAPGYVPRVFAEIAIALGHGDAPDASVKLPVAGTPDARLLAARVAFARGGKTGLRDYVTGLAPGLVEVDPDLGALALLAETSPLDPAVRAKLDERAEKSAGYAAYVVGRHALEAGEAKLAAQRLYRAATTSGETCEAARLLLTIDRKLRPPGVATDAKVNALVRGHGGCTAKPAAP